jgi:uncharacterized protein (DUF1800 family)
MRTYPAGAATGPLSFRRWRHGAAAVLSAVIVAACGGGGGGGTTPPPPPPPVTITKAEAFRFLNQATFGATEAEAQRVIQLGYSAWIDQQQQVPASTTLPLVQAGFAELTDPGSMMVQLNGHRVDGWFRNAVNGPDQLRQRVAFALSQIMVVSQVGALDNAVFATADYYDMLARNAFANYRVLLEDVTLHPAMGIYLSMLGNQKANPARNIRPDENYAREVMQLFSVGLVMLNQDGSRVLQGGQPVPTYAQANIEGFARTFTGWNWSCLPSIPNCTFGQARPEILPVNNTYTPMQAFANQHETGTKQLLEYPGAAKPLLPAGQTPQQDLADALDNLFNHPNVAPFITRQLIQRLVTSNPSPAYVQRVAAVFANDGTGRRGNLGAVVKAILLDTEARTAPATTAGSKVKEPLLRLTQLWREYGGRSQSGRFVVLAPFSNNVLSNASTAGLFGQGPLQSPSVFNFFSPFYAPPGEISDGNLVAPELQIATEYVNAQVSNYLFDRVLCRTQAPFSACAPANTNNTVTIDVSGDMAVAADSEALLNRIAGRLLGGEISATLKAQAKAQVDRVPANLPDLRVAEALHLVLTSPEYALQR